VRRYKHSPEGRKTICNFYVSVEFKEKVWPEFKTICAREESSASEKLRDMIDEYVRLHAAGNPQSRLDVIMKLDKPYRAGVCLDCGDKAKYETWINGVKVFLCALHFNKRRMKLQGYREIGKNAPK
jgi:hypothetical protein